MATKSGLIPIRSSFSYCPIKHQEQLATRHPHPALPPTLCPRGPYSGPSRVILWTTVDSDHQETRKPRIWEGKASTRVSISLYAGGSGSLKNDREVPLGWKHDKHGDCLSTAGYEAGSQTSQQGLWKLYGSPELKKGNKGVLNRRFESY